MSLGHRVYKARTGRGYSRKVFPDITYAEYVHLAKSQATRWLTRSVIRLNLTDQRLDTFIARMHAFGSEKVELATIVADNYRQYRSIDAWPDSSIETRIAEADEARLCLKPFLIPDLAAIVSDYIQP